VKSSWCKSQELFDKGYYLDYKMPKFWIGHKSDQNNFLKKNISKAFLKTRLDLNQSKNPTKNSVVIIKIYNCFLLIIQVSFRTFGIYIENIILSLDGKVTKIGKVKMLLMSYFLLNWTKKDQCIFFFGKKFLFSIEKQIKKHFARILN
jgi:hypothetical protein